MVVIFASATALLTPEFVESIEPEKLASKFVKVEKEHGVKFNKTSSTFNIVGQWDAIQHAHKSLKQWWPLPPDSNGILQHSVLNFATPCTGALPVALKVEDAREDPDEDNEADEVLEHEDDQTEVIPAVEEVAYHKIKGNPKRGRHAVECKQNSLVPEPVVFFQYQDKSFENEDGVNIDAVLEEYERAQTEKKVTKDDLKKILEKNTEQMGRPLHKNLPKGALLPLGKVGKDVERPIEDITKSSLSSTFLATSNSVPALKMNIAVTGTGSDSNASAHFDKSIASCLSYASHQTTYTDAVDGDWVVVNNGTMNSDRLGNLGNISISNLLTTSASSSSITQNTPTTSFGRGFDTPCSIFSEQDLINVSASQQDLINISASQQNLINVRASQQDLINVRASQQDLINISAQTSFGNSLDATLPAQPDVTFVTLQQNPTFSTGVSATELNLRPEIVTRPNDPHVMPTVISSQGDMINSQRNIIHSQGDIINSQGDVINCQGDVTNSLGNVVNSQRDVTYCQKDVTYSQDVPNSQGDAIYSQGDIMNSKGDVVNFQRNVPSSQGNVIFSKSNATNSEGNMTSSVGSFVGNPALISTLTNVVALTSTDDGLVPVNGTMKSPEVVVMVNSDIGSSIPTETTVCADVRAVSSVESNNVGIAGPAESSEDVGVAIPTGSSHGPTSKPLDLAIEDDGSEDKSARQISKENDITREPGDDQSTKSKQGTIEHKAQTKPGTVGLMSKQRIMGHQARAMKGGRKRTKKDHSTDTPKEQVKKPKRRKTTGKVTVTVNEDGSEKRVIEGLEKGTLEGSEKGAIEGSEAATIAESGGGTTPGEQEDNNHSDTTEEKQTLQKSEKHSEGSKQKSESRSEGSVLYKCTECDYQGRRKKRLTEHMGRVHGLLTEFCRGSQEKTTFPCDQCDKTFVFGKDLNRHKKIVHHGLIHYCKICDKSYKAKYVYEKHMTTHEEGYVQPMFPCQICERQFTTKFSLGSHIKSEHLGLKKTYICPTCGKSFSQIRSYRQHANVHAGIRPYVCEICGKSFTYDKSLKEHRYMHDTVRRFPCSVCNKAFRQRTCLLIHMKVHKNSKDHICSSCGKGFTQRQSLLRHERIHSGDKPYACKLCQKSFSDYAVIRKHMLMSHKKDKSNWKEDVTEAVKQTSNHYIIGGPGYVPRDTSASIREKNQATVIPPVIPGGAPTITPLPVGQTTITPHDKENEDFIARNAGLIARSDIDSILEQSARCIYTKSMGESYQVSNSQYQSNFCTNPSVDTIADTSIAADDSSGISLPNAPVNYSGLVNQMCLSDQGIVMDETMMATILKQQQGRQPITDLLPVSQGGNSNGTLNIISFDQRGQLMLSMPSAAVTMPSGPVTMTTEPASMSTELILTSTPTGTSVNSWGYPECPSYYSTAGFSQYSQNPQ